jgi:uncharacterized membrane protein
MPKRTSRWLGQSLWITLALYALARLCQLIANRLPTHLIVILHVVPPAVFALLHGARLYGTRGILRFAGICLSVATIAETLSLRTDFPHGHYYFTEVMGPKLFGLPFLLVFAYLGIGYCAWIIAGLILPPQHSPILLQPLLAAVVMTAWDLAMDPDWATLDHAWIWRDGGAVFGVPLSNYCGWMLTAFTFYLLFALTKPEPHPEPSLSFHRLPVLLYALCAAGNLLIVFRPMAPPIVLDQAGHPWHTTAVLTFMAFVSTCIMLPLAALAWFNAASHPCSASALSLSDPISS